MVRGQKVSLPWFIEFGLSSVMYPYVIPTLYPACPRSFTSSVSVQYLTLGTIRLVRDLGLKANEPLLGACFFLCPTPLTYNKYIRTVEKFVNKYLPFYKVYWVLASIQV